MRVGVVGLGLIGGSVALALRGRPGIEVLGLDRDRQAVTAALAAQAIRASARSVAELAAASDLVVLCTPIDATLEVLGELRAAGRPGLAITDTASVKVPVVARARELGLTAFVGGHPMAGSERQGFAGARGDLFAGKTFFLTPEPATAPVPAALEQFVTLLGARPRRLSAAEHDRLVAATSHLPHLVAALLVDAVGGTASVAALRDAVGSGFLDTTRIAGASPGLWRQILLHNRKEVVRALRALLRRGEALAELLEQGDGDGLEAFLAAASALRAELRPADPAT